MQILGESRADAVDERLHAERLAPHRRAELGALPDAAFVLRESEPWLVFGDALLRWSPSGYAERVTRPRTGAAKGTTPPPLLAVLRAGFTGVVPLVHPSAG